MIKDYIKDQIIEILCKEYQTIWLIRIKDLSMETFTINEKEIIQDSVTTVLNLNSYEEARYWYVKNCVIERSKARVLKQTELNYVLQQIKDGNQFFIEYDRSNNGIINLNQLCYDKIVNPVDGTPEYLVLGFRDIDMTKKIEIDDTTGVLTRSVFFREAEEMMRNYPDLQYDAVISDIVDFKKINETYGADVADRILKWHGAYLVSLTNEQLIVGRYGGDQMVLFGSHEEIMKCLSSQYRDKFLDSERSNGLPSITIKYGIYIDVKHGMSILSICDRAHMALNSIKHHYSKEIAYYNDIIKNQLEKRRRIEESMYTSLYNGDFKVYYQPKHNAKTGELAGAEALIRWIHPEYGFMSPADFIPLFEQNGFIIENDKYVWKRTCENLRKWANRGIKTVPISINGSRLTMASDDFIDVMKDSIEKNGLSANQLHLEITETLMEDDTPLMIKKLNQIRALGIKIELDDFGSGYSSLNVLSELPLDVVKLDMSFMQQFGDKKRSMVLESCISLAKKLGFETISEGVEEKEQQELLGLLGVDLIQGYYYSKPLPEDEFEIYMMQYS